MRQIPVELDGPTERLIALAQGAEDAGIMPTASARNLVKLARSVRRFALAGEAELAALSLKAVHGMGTSAAEDTEPGADVLGAALQAHSTRVLRNLGAAGRPILESLPEPKAIGS